MVNKQGAINLEVKKMKERKVRRVKLKPQADAEDNGRVQRPFTFFDDSQD